MPFFLSEVVPDIPGNIPEGAGGAGVAGKRTAGGGEASLCSW